MKNTVLYKSPYIPIYGPNTLYEDMLNPIRKHSPSQIDIVAVTAGLAGLEALWFSFGLCSRVSGRQGGCGGGSAAKWLQLEICSGIPKTSYLDGGRSQQF